MLVSVDGESITWSIRPIKDIDHEAWGWHHSLEEAIFNLTLCF